MIRQKKYKLLEQLLLFKIKSSFSLECFSYKPKPEVLFLTRVSSKLLEKNFARKNLIIQFKYPSFFSNRSESQKKTFFLKTKKLIFTTFLNTEYFFNRILGFYSLKKGNILEYFFHNFIIIHV